MRGHSGYLKLGPRPSQRGLPIAKIEAKLRKLTSIDYDCHNWSCWIRTDLQCLQSYRGCLLRVRANIPPNQRNLCGRKAGLPPNRKSHSGSEPTGRRSWEVEGPGTDESYQEEEGSNSVFASSVPWGEFLIFFGFSFGELFLDIYFSFAEEAQDSIRRIDDKGKADLLEAAVTPPSTISEQSPVAEEA